MADNENKEILFTVFGTEVKTKSVVYIGILLFVGWFLLHWFYSTEIPGHWLEKSSYETKLYVNVFPDKEDTKNYRLVGDVQRIHDCDNDEGNEYCYSWYNVSKITFPEDGYIEFDDCQLYLDKKERCLDYDGDAWYVELTNQKP